MPDQTQPPASEIEALRQSVNALRAQVRDLAGQVAALEWLLKLQPSGIAVEGGRILTKTLYGTLLYVSAEDRLIAPHVVLDRVFEPEVTLLLDSLVQPGDTVVDVGANIGYYSCMLGRKVGPQGRVFAFEADPETCRLLRDNIMLNDLLGWTSYRNVAVSSESGSLKLFRRKKYHGNTSIIRLAPEVLNSFGDTDEEFEVASEPLDSLLEGCDRPISVIKIDVEGAEASVLKGMQGIVRRNPNVKIVLEWALWAIRDAGGSPEEMWGLIESLGLTPLRIGQQVTPTNLDELQQTEICYLLLQRP